VPWPLPLSVSDLTVI